MKNMDTYCLNIAYSMHIQYFDVHLAVDMILWFYFLIIFLEIILFPTRISGSLAFSKLIKQEIVCKIKLIISYAWSKQ